MKQFVTTIFLFFSLSITAGVVDHDAMFKAYLDNDMKRWGVMLDGYMKQPKLTLGDKIDLCNYLYGYVATLVKTVPDKELERWISRWEAYIADIEKAGRETSNVHVYRSAIAAYRCRTYKWKMLSYAGDAMDELKLAMKADANNPIAIGLKGNVLFYKPGFVGGDKKESIKYFERAIALLTPRPDKLYRWNRCAMQLCLAQAYEKTGDRASAQKIAKEMEREYPDNRFLVEEFIPSVMD